jgi:hypothetical protein
VEQLLDTRLGHVRTMLPELEMEGSGIPGARIGK